MSKQDKMKQIFKFRLCSDRDKMINDIISKRSKLAQKEKRLGGEGDPLRIVLEV